MGDPTFFRARLTGVVIEDPADLSAPGSKQALATFIKEDSDTGTSDTVQATAKVVLSTSGKCTLAVTNLFYFGTAVGPLVLPLARALQPKVIVRRDSTNDAGTGACWSIVLDGVMDHSHLIAGNGPAGGGVAFACFAPSTKDEANALGYTDLT